MPAQLCRKIFLVPSSFPYSLHLHVWFDIPASMSIKQPVTYHHFAMGLCQLYYNMFTSLTLGTITSSYTLRYRPASSQIPGLNYRFINKKITVQCDYNVFLEIISTNEYNGRHKIENDKHNPYKYLLSK